MGMSMPPKLTRVPPNWNGNGNEPAGLKELGDRLAREAMESLQQAVTAPAGAVTEGIGQKVS